MHSTAETAALPELAAVNGKPRRVPVEVAGIAAVASALPERVVPNAEVAERLGVAPEWISSRTGVQERRVAAPGETLVDLSERAARGALGLAEIDAADLDLVLVATFTADELLPHASPQLADRLGATPAGAVDVGAACNGFLSSLAFASAQIEARRADAVLVVGADLMSRIVDRDDRATAGLFGDGAGAAVLTAGGPGAIGPILLRADGAAARTLTASHAERLLRMDGRETFRRAVAALARVTVEATAASGLELSEPDLFVYHQANSRILAAVGQRLGLDPARVVDSVARVGNTSAASLPIALTEAAADGRLRPGTRVLLAAFGAGFSWGGGVIEWGGRA
jgi:3-oxoacyl-[acyl-carrier-protein] synthase III